MSPPKIRPATHADLERFYGRFPWTFRAFAAELDGEVLGIGGIYYHREYVVAFSHAKDDAHQKYPFTAARMTKKIMGLVDGRPCIAIVSDTIPGAPALLERLGFEKTEGRVWRWPMDHSA
jgi:hypothetical protein